MENITVRERNKMALTFGLITGIIYIVITTAIYALVSDWLMFNALKIVGFLVYIFIIGFFATRIRKANGGYIEFKELFGGVFLMVIVAGLMSYLYNYLYINVIDPQFLPHFKAATIAYMEKAHVPDASIEETAKKFDIQIAEAKTLNLSKNLLTFFGSLIVDSLFAMVVCLIVKKQRPFIYNA